MDGEDYIGHITLSLGVAAAERDDTLEALLAAPTRPSMPLSAPGRSRVSIVWPARLPEDSACPRALIRTPCKRLSMSEPPEITMDSRAVQGKARQKRQQPS